MNKVSNIELGKHFGNWCVSSYIKKEYDELGSIQGGHLSLINQETCDTIVIDNDKALRGDKWFSQSIKGICIENKSINKVLEQIIIAYDKLAIKSNNIN